MILRRVIEHVKRQDWTAVALDFVIVVLGVFMGIQLGNWNEDRASNVRSAQLLDRLEEEFRLFETALTKSQEDLILFESSTINLLDAIRQDTLDTTDPEQVAYWLGLARQMSRPQARSAVLLEMVSSGELSLLPENIRLAVTQFDQQIQRNEYLWPEAVGYLTSSKQLFDAVDYAYIGYKDRVLDFEAEKLPLAETNLETIMLYQGALKYAVTDSLEGARSILDMIDAYKK